MKGERVLGVDPLHKSGLKYSVYFLLVFLYLCKILFISFLYINCCKLFEEVFNPRINKAIIIIIIMIIIIIKEHYLLQFYLPFYTSVN